MRFTLEIDDDFLDILDSLADLGLDQPPTTPEEAVELAIFTHLESHTDTST